MWSSVEQHAEPCSQKKQRHAHGFRVNIRVASSWPWIGTNHCSGPQLLAYVWPVVLCSQYPLLDGDTAALSGVRLRSAREAGDSAGVEGGRSNAWRRSCSANVVGVLGGVRGARNCVAGFFESARPVLPLCPVCAVRTPPPFLSGCRCSRCRAIKPESEMAGDTR